MLHRGRIDMRKNIEVKFEAINNANHFYKKKEKELSTTVNEYIKRNIPIY